MSLNPAGALRSLVPDPGPQRIFALSVLINTIGFGMILPAMVLYAIRVVHLSGEQAGLGLTIAGAVALAAALPMGDLADRYGPRQATQAGMLVQCLAAICYLFVGNFAEFVIVATVDMVSMNALLSFNAVLLRRVGGEDATVFRARSRAIVNLGLALGLVGYSAAVQIGTPDAYRSLFLVNALTFAATWAVLGRLPRYEPLHRPAGAPRWVAITDKAFVGFAAINGAMGIQYSVLTLLLPLWVVDRTHAPRWSISLLVLINTIVVVLFQVRVGRNVKSLRNGGSALRHAGVVFLVSCSAMGLATGLPGWAALLLLVAAVILHSFGELWHAAGSFALEFGLAPKHAQGQYHGLLMISAGGGQAAAPVLLVGLCLSLGRTGWAGLGACFALLGLVGPTLARWGERTRLSAAEPSEPAHASVE